MFVTIEPGEKGVLFKNSVEVLTKKLFIHKDFTLLPLGTLCMYILIKFKDTFEKMEVLSKNGLSIKIDLSFRYQPVSDQIGYLHDEVGKDYLEKIIKPEIKISNKRSDWKLPTEELYSTKKAIEDEIYDSTKKKIESKYLILDAILIRDIIDPQTLRAAIEQKLKQEQERIRV